MLRLSVSIDGEYSNHEPDLLKYDAVPSNMTIVNVYVAFRRQNWRDSSRFGEDGRPVFTRHNGHREIALSKCYS